jgi:hypothetical protein
MPQYRLLRPLSRLVRGKDGRLHSASHQAGDVIEPTDAELRAFGDRLEPVQGRPVGEPSAPASPEPGEPGAEAPAPADAPPPRRSR